MWVYFITYLIATGNGDVKEKAVFFEGRAARLFHDHYNYKRPNSAEIDSVFINPENFKEICLEYRKKIE